MTGTIQAHNTRPAAVWSAGGKDYDEISRGIADAIEHCVLRLKPQPGERILDLSTGTGWTSRVVARRGATVTGVDIAQGLLDAARERAAAEGLPIAYRLGDVVPRRLHNRPRHLRPPPVFGDGRRAKALRDLVMP